MATRHSIVHIEFQANAGKANAALKALQSEAARTKAEVERLRGELARAKAANLPTDQIQKLEAELKKARTEHRQWQSALDNNLKGVRALDEAIKMFNKGKGSVEGMNAALSKTALNAAKLQQNRSDEGSKTWKEMDALAVALNQNIMRCNTALNQMIGTIKSGGKVSKDTLTQAKSDLQQMIALENQGSKGWVKYTGQLKVVEGALKKLTLEEQRMAGQSAMSQVFSGQYITKSRSELEQMIAKLKEYQATIADPTGKGARHFAATETAIKKISEQLAKTRGDVASFQQAMKIAGAAGMANKFGSNLPAQQQKLAQSYAQTAAQLQQLQAKRQTYTIIQQNGLSITAQEQAMLARLDAQIATTTAQLDRERQAMIQAGQANNLTNREITQSIAILRQQQETVAAGSVTWNQCAAAIATLEERQKIMRGEAMALADAMKLASVAGRAGFKGTATQLQQAQQAIEKAAASATKGSVEWQKYQQALSRLRVEMNNAGITSERMQAILNRPTSARNLNELSAAVKRAKAELDLMAGTIGKNAKAYSDMAAKTKQAESQLKAMQGQAKGTATAFEKAWSRLKTYVGLYVGAAVAMQKIMATFSDIMALSDRMGEVRKTTGFTADEVGRLVTNLRQLDTRSTLTSLMELSVAAGQLGLKTQEDVKGFTEAANMLMVALPEMGKDAATQMMKVALATGEVKKIQEQMDAGVIEGSSAVAVAMTKVASTIDQLRANSAAAAPAITDFVQRVGAVGAQSGITLDQVAALGSTVDALGLRTEMAATALSRMIPAIKANAFDISQIIGVTPDTIRELFDAGRGMEVILMILQSIKDRGLDDEGIEGMLGMGSLGEIMKELNQRGARAGIVFASLSQNVDELRRQLGVASTAYEENIAILNEYNKMNETTAAKWAKLKNEVEEAFVGDQAQKALGWIIDRLRAIVDLLTGRVTPALQLVGISLKTIFAYWMVMKIGIGEALLITLPKALMTFRATAVTAFSTIGTQIKAATFYLGVHTMATKRAAVEMRKMNAAQLANFWFAIAAAIAYATYALYNWSQRLNTTVNALSEAEANLASTTRAVSEQFAKLKTLSDKQKDLADNTKQLKDREAELRDELEALRKKYGEGAEKTEEYKKKQEELEEAHKKVATAEGEASDATNRRLAVIAEINSKYSTYLGYMLSEASTAETVASAHDLIIAALKEEMYWREKNTAFQTVTEQHQEQLKKYREKSLAEMNDENVDIMRQQNIMSAWQAQLSKVTYDASKGGFQLIPGGTAYSNLDDALDAMKERFNMVLSTEGGYYMVHTNDKQDRLNDWWGGSIDDGFRDWTKESLKILQESAMLQNLSGSAAQQAHTDAVQRTRENTNALITQAQLREGDKDYKGNRQIAEAIVGIQKNISKYGEIAGDYQQFAADTSLKGIANVLLKDLPADTRKAVESEMERVAANGINPPSPTRPKNPWGTTQPAESLEYNNMTAKQLVSRRNQMNDFVNAIQTDTDVKAVLNEDKALKKAIEAGMSSDMRTVIEWYNTERLKIQDELHARHLTNTGDWLDPKKERGAKKQFRDEMDAYLHELDAYYTERKTRIEQARNDEEITEGEAWRRTIQNDNEWQTRRAELQKLYSRKQKEVTQEELDAIIRIIAERTGDSEAFVKAAIAKTNQFVDAIEKSGDKGAAIVHRWMSQVVLDTERSYLKAAQAIGKQMKFIEDTLAKERPYDGITKNLQDNLDKMGVLAAKYRRENEELARQGKEPKYSNEQITAQSYDEMAFYLRQAADAYSIDIDELLRRMVKEGMTATAEEISKSDMLKQAVMGQLRKTYQEVQDAVKKEASQIKKDVEIIWNDDARGIGGMSMKATFDKALAQLGMQQDSVSRANSLIGAGAASDNVASRLAMKQIEVQMRMQKAQYDMYRVQANQRMAALKAEAEEHRRLAKQAEQEKNFVEQGYELLKATNAERDAENVRLSLGLTLAEETKKEEQQKAELLKVQEESQNRLYTSLREWADLLTSSLQGVMEASHAGDAEYYNERAKLNLTGKGGPGAGTYVVIDDAGTSDATAHYEYLDERQALERQHEIEVQNAQAEAWRKLMDDLNMKMSEQITDWMNAALQNQSIDANTQAVIANTQALWAQLERGTSTDFTDAGQLKRDENGFALDSSGQVIAPIQPTEPAQTEQPTSYWPIGDTEQKPMWTATDPANTAATDANTQAVNALTQALGGQAPDASTPADVPAASAPAPAPAGGGTTDGVFLQKPFFQMTEEEKAQAMTAIGELWQAYNEGGVTAMTEMAASLAEIPGVVLPPWQIREDELEAVMERMGTLWQSYAEQGIAAMQQMSDAMAEMPNKIPDPTGLTEDKIEKAGESLAALGQKEIDMSNLVTQKKVENKKMEVKSQTDGNKKEETSTQSSFAKMAAAANMYGLAYQTMSNDNLSTAQKFQTFALQAAGQAAIAMLTTDLFKAEADQMVKMPGILGKLLGEMPYPAAIATYAGITALMGGLMGLAASQVSKSKSQIAQATGASVGAGRLATGMLTYAEGNVNELTDPASLTPGRHYNVDGADGKTYRARYMGKGAKTHITNGAEFHLVGEAGREAIIDAKTTRLLQMNETGIWRDIQTLYNGGSISGLSTRRRRGGVRAFADGNVGEFEDMADGGTTAVYGTEGMGMEQMLTALDRNSAIQEALLERLNQPIYAQNILYGPDGLPNVINKLNKEAQRHGEKYL